MDECGDENKWVWQIVNWSNFEELHRFYCSRMIDGREHHTATSTNAADPIEINEKSAESEKTKDILLPIECLAPSEPSFYDWKEITGEFLGAVKGLICLNIGLCRFCEYIFCVHFRVAIGRIGAPSDSVRATWGNVRDWNDGSENGCRFALQQRSRRTVDIYHCRRCK